MCLSQARRGQGQIVTFGRAACQVTDDVIIDGEHAYPVRGIVLRAGTMRRTSPRRSPRYVRSSLERAVVAKVPRRVKGASRIAHGLRARAVAFATSDDSKANQRRRVRHRRALRHCASRASRADLIGEAGQGQLRAARADAMPLAQPAAAVPYRRGHALARAFDGVVPVRPATDMNDAVARRRTTPSPATPCCSPACSSFDISGLQRRGDVFVRAVQNST